MQPMNSCLYRGTEEIQSQEGGLCQAVHLPWGPGRTRAGSCICRVGGLPVRTTPAKATGLTGAAARRGRAGPGVGAAASAFTLPQTLLPYLQWRPGPCRARGQTRLPGPWRARADFHSQKALLFNKIFVAGKVLLICIRRKKF